RAAAVSLASFEGPAPPLPVPVSRLVARRTAPFSVGVPVTWTATATGGTAPLQYEFLRLDVATNTWVPLGGYGTGNTFAWTPTTAAGGPQHFRAWARSAGAAAPCRRRPATRPV